MTEHTRDQIFLDGMIFYGYHGVHDEEQRLGQRFHVDLAVSCDLLQAGRTDNLDATVSYSELYRVAREVVEGLPRKLLESVAEAISAAVLERFALVQEVVVTVRKPEAPIKGSVLTSAGVRIARRRG